MIGWHGLPHRSPPRRAVRVRRDFGLIAAGLVLAVTGIGVTGPATPAHAEDGLPQAEALIQKMIDATGGKAAYDRQQSQLIKGKVRVPKAKIVLMHTVWAQRPNKRYDLMEAPAFGKIESGCDGSTVWEISEDGGPRLKSGPELPILLREADFDNWTNWKKYYKSATTVGADTVAGQATWKIQMVPVEGPPEMKWMDQATGLLLKTSLRRQTGIGEIPVEIFYEGYRDVCGLKIPFRTREVALAGLPEIVTTHDSVTCNPPVPEGRFDLPAEIKVLADAAKAAGEASLRPQSDVLAKDYLSVILFALNRSSDGLRSLGRPAIRQHGLDGTRVQANISADGFDMVPTSLGTGIIFGSAWSDPLPKILGRRGDFPPMSFRKGSVDILEQDGVQTLRIEEGTEMQLGGETWVFHPDKWELASPPK
jgi:hypothetical protein